MKKRKLEPVSQQENRDRYEREYWKLDQFIDEWYDGDHQEIEHSDISEMERKLKRLTPALRELKRDAPVNRPKQEATVPYFPVPFDTRVVDDENESESLANSAARGRDLARLANPSPVIRAEHARLQAERQREAERADAEQRMGGQVREPKDRSPPLSPAVDLYGDLSLSAISERAQRTPTTNRLPLTHRCRLWQ